MRYGAAEPGAAITGTGRVLLTVDCFCNTALVEWEYSPGSMPRRGLRTAAVAGLETMVASSGSANTSGTKSTVAPLPKAQSKIKPPADVSCSRPASRTFYSDGPSQAGSLSRAYVRPARDNARSPGGYVGHVRPRSRLDRDATAAPQVHHRHGPAACRGEHLPSGRVCRLNIRAQAGWDRPSRSVARVPIDRQTIWRAHIDGSVAVRTRPGPGERCRSRH
jgi:hypothetical protein